MTELPAKGRPHPEVIDALRAMKEGDADWRGGRVMALVYHAGDAHHALLEEAHNTFFSDNLLNPMAFKSLRRLESEVVRMTASLLHGDASTAGTMTSGGTESLLLAVKTYRDLARAKRPWIRRPEMVLPETAHVAFDKAGHYFGVRPRWVPVRSDFAVDLRAMKKLIGRNTIFAAASAPQYPHGVIDPIAEIGALCADAKVPFHVDACMGGFVLPFMERLGRKLAPWDFRVPGVTSISADLHKYGYAAKGASVLVYRSMDILKRQFFVSTEWPGGIYASPTIPGTRPGGPVAAAWAAMMALGEDGYLAHTRRALDAAEKLVAGVRRIEGLRVLGEPEATLVAYASSRPDVDIYAVADQMEARGWHVDRQQRPASIHCTLMSQHAEVIDRYLADLAECATFVRAHPEVKSKGNAAMYGMMAKIPVRSAVKLAVTKVMEDLYAPSGPRAVEGPGEGKLGQLIERYGDRATAILDRVESIRARFGAGAAR